MRRIRGVQWLLLGLVAALALGCAARGAVQMPAEAPMVEYAESEKAAREESFAVAGDRAGMPMPGEADGTVHVQAS